jgi:hypothetical protein
VIEQDRKTDRPAAWTQFSNRTNWHYDVLRGLDYFRVVRAVRDERVSQAIGIVASTRRVRPMAPR